MVFGALRVKAKAKSGRGSIDANAVVEAMMTAWDDLKSAIAGLPENEQQELRDHFNNFIEDEDDLGDILFGDADAFDSKIKFLDDEMLKQYTEEILDKQLIDRDGLTEE